MSEPRFSPLPPDAPKEDRIDTAVLAMASGAAAAVTWFALLTLMQLHLLAGSTARSVSEIDPHSFDVNFMVYGSLCGAAFAGAVSWSLMASIPSSYRRGGLSLVAAFAGTVFAGILTYLGRSIGGVPALSGIALIFATTAVAVGRRALVTAR